MKIDFINGGVFSYVMPAMLIVMAILALRQIFQGQFAGVIVLLIFGGVAAFGFSLYAGSHDADALRAAASQRYGLSITSDQAKVLREDHSYRKYGPDVTVASDHGTAKPYGTTKVSLRGVKEEVMLYEAHGLRYIGVVPDRGAASQKVRELPVNSSIPSLN